MNKTSHPNSMVRIRETFEGFRSGHTCHLSHFVLLSVKRCKTSNKGLTQNLTFDDRRYYKAIVTSWGIGSDFTLFIRRKGHWYFYDYDNIEELLKVWDVTFNRQVLIEKAGHSIRHFL